MSGVAHWPFTGTEYTIVVPGLPPSVNAKKHWAAVQRDNRTWYDKVALCALGLKIPRPAFQSAIVEIELRYTIPKTHGGRRRRDVDNVAKRMLDALVRCKILVDDSYPSLHETRLRARPGDRDEVILIVREA
jgi:Holliday junction resolvase RusA-like endonuclease